MELHGGDIIYYDDTGIRDRYKSKKSEDMIIDIGYESPAGRFIELRNRMTGRSVIFILTAPSSVLMRYEYHAETVPGGFDSSTIIGGRELD